MPDPELTRRRLLELGLVLPLATRLDVGPRSLAATPSCDDGDEDETAAETEGPYFKPGTPRRRTLVTPAIAGTRLTLTGRVLSTSCRPVPRALLSFWQADASGEYDNDGFRLRGHQFTDARGRWRLDTIVPGVYPGRTRHIHVKVQAPRQRVLTTQLYFPGVAQNARDRLFRRDLVVSGWRRSGARRLARFDFVLDVG